ncbi:hypothetical protein EDD85DRAFT_963034 [Armillaria nabsnona]|nr:hypothetical protein EDD85DRAFT_963034 [Armillaria nabsnona]
MFSSHYAQALPSFIWLQCSQDLPGLLVIVVVVIAALFVFVPSPLLNACSHSVLAEAPDFGFSAWSVGMLDGVIGGDGAGFEVMAGEASPSP